MTLKQKLEWEERRHQMKIERVIAIEAKREAREEWLRERTQEAYEQAKSSVKPYLSPAHAAILLRCDQNDLRWQARTDPSVLGFPVVIIKSRVKIPRKAFLDFYETNIKEEYE